jgi:hypothetical protein
MKGYGTSMYARPRTLASKGWIATASFCLAARLANHSARSYNNIEQVKAFQTLMVSSSWTGELYAVERISSSPVGSRIQAALFAGGMVAAGNQSITQLIIEITVGGLIYS